MDVAAAGDGADAEERMRLQYTKTWQRAVQERVANWRILIK